MLQVNIACNIVIIVVLYRYENVPLFSLNYKKGSKQPTILWIFLLVNILWTPHVLLCIAPNAYDKPKEQVAGGWEQGAGNCWLGAGSRDWDRKWGIAVSREQGSK